MKLRFVMVAALGLALALYFVTYVGLGAVFSAAVTVGWGGFAILCLYALALFLLLGAAWYVLLPQLAVRRLRVLVWARMVRDAAAEVLPFSQLGGIVLGARAAILHGVSQPARLCLDDRRCHHRIAGADRLRWARPRRS